MKKCRMCESNKVVISLKVERATIHMCEACLLIYKENVAIAERYSKEEGAKIWLY